MPSMHKFIVFNINKEVYKMCVKCISIYSNAIKAVGNFIILK